MVEPDKSYEAYLVHLYAHSKEKKNSCWFCQGNPYEIIIRCELK
jgi:hypothetical protein